MRVVLVSPAYPLRGAMSHFGALLSATLTSRGHSVSILSYKRQYPGLFFPGKTQMDEGEEMIPVNAHFGLDTINPFTWITSFLWLRRLHPDVLIVNHWMPFFLPTTSTLAHLSKRFLKIPSIWICHNIKPHERRPGDRFLTRWGLRPADRFIVLSDAVRKDLEQFRPNANIKLVPHPVYTLFPSAGPKEEARARLGITEKHVLLYFGYIRKYKGVRTLIQALPSILKAYPVRLLICGEFYEGREEILRLVQTLHIQRAVTITDRYIANEDVADYFSACDLVVLPYVSATQSGVVQLAYHYARPVVVTQVGGLPEMVREGETGYIVPPEEPEALAEAVIRHFHNGHEEAFAQAIQTAGTNASWDRLAEVVEDLAGIDA